MDSKGYWHDFPPPAAAPERDPEQYTGNERPRYVASMEIGEHVEIVKQDGTRIKAQFWEAKGNKVILRTLPL